MPTLDQGIVCFKYGELGHITSQCQRGLASISSSIGSVRTGGNVSSSNCGRGRGAINYSTTPGRVFAMTLYDAQATCEVVTGTLSISSRDACVLMDLKSTHSFISCVFSMHLDKTIDIFGY